jgi:hypothetical protein
MERAAAAAGGVACVASVCVELRCFVYDIVLRR